MTDKGKPWILCGCACALLAVTAAAVFMREPGYVAQRPQSGMVSSPSKTTTHGKRININTADEEEWMQLPGIGKTVAQAIIAYREQHGRFQYIEQLMLVDGIGEKRFAQIRDYLAID